MPKTQLKAPYFDDGIRSVNFFNGRVLSGEDLSQEQVARQTVALRLGRAAGAGIVGGLEVATAQAGNSAETPLVTVQPGLAVNAQGQTMELLRPVDVSLLPPPSPAQAQAPLDEVFAPCPDVVGTPGATVYTAGTGVYVLLICPLEGREGRAVSGGIGAGLSLSCSAKSRVEGVQFKLVNLGLTSGELQAGSRLRNLAAHRCFGSLDLALDAAVSDPFGPTRTGYGQLDKLRDEGSLADCDVPLALIHWRGASETSNRGIRFVDLWSVRRRLVRSPGAGALSSLLDDRRQTEAEAMLAQFQVQLEKVGLNALAGLEARERFRFLPPAGLLPLGGSGGVMGANLDKFFTGVTRRPPLPIEGARVRHALELAFQFPPIDLDSATMVWLYTIRENGTPPAGGGKAPQPYVLFAAGHLPCLAEARFDVAHWNFASYAPV
jgi:hypothetical protein